MRAIDFGRGPALADASDRAFAFDWRGFPWGSDYYASTGKMIADEQ